MEENKKAATKEQQPLLSDINVLHEDSNEGISICIQVHVSMNDSVVDMSITQIREYLHQQFETCKAEASGALNYLA